jgi:hypothetical protein
MDKSRYNYAENLLDIYSFAGRIELIITFESGVLNAKFLISICGFMGLMKVSLFSTESYS